jgi:hypothetical protein
MTAVADELSSNGDVTSSADSPFISESVPADDFDFFDGPPPSSGDVVDAELISESPGRSIKSDPAVSLDRPAKSGVPDIHEWMHFFSNVFIRLSTDFYIDWAFRDVDENDLSEREIERIKLTDVERDRMARPFAEFSNKSKFMRKRGRVIISSADSIDAILQMGMWFSRTSRIAARHKRKSSQPSRPRPVRATPVFRSPAAPPPAPVPVPDNGSDDNVGSGQSAPFARPPGVRPDIVGTVFNPTGGG